MTSKNKFAKYALGWSGGALVTSLLLAWAGLFVSALSIFFGIKGLMAYNKDNTIGGKSQAIIAIIVSGIFFILSLIAIIGRLLAKPSVPMIFS